ncbi:MAG: bifunctional histidinol-phosphatase/imidazoleglycerol-phosphate dehydratase HisB [Bacteroidota bacterium]
MKKILLLDRDGTLIVEPPEDYQVDRFDKLAFLPGVIQELVRLKQQRDYVWVMITNQDGLGTESFPEDTFWPVHNLMMQILEGEGLAFDEVVIDKTFKKDNAPTRKPNTALLTHYMNGDYDLANSVVVGDRPSDIQLAKNLGAKGILIGRSTDALDDEWDLEALKKDTLVLQSESWTEITDFLIAEGRGNRSASVHRTTKETDIKVRVDLDGVGKTSADTGIGFFDHMLDQLGKHGKMDLDISVKGDLHIDAHHTIEDTALALGQAFREAIGNKRGIERYGCFNLVMDDALAEVAIDFSGRPMLVWQADYGRDKVGEMPTEMVEHFFQSFCDTARCNLHVRVSGRNAHHMVEATFKGVARAIRNAKSKIAGDDSLPSTKGVL